MKVDRRIALMWVFLLVLSAGVGCRFRFLGPISPPQDTKVTETAINLKVEAGNLMAKATEPYNQHQAEAEKFQSDMSKAYEYAAAIPNNQETAQMWAIMKDPSQPLMGGFLRRWKEKSTLLPAYIQEKKGEIEAGFDKIIQLEAGKPK